MNTGSGNNCISTKTFTRLAALLLAFCLLPLLPFSAGAEEMQVGNLFGSQLMDSMAYVVTQAQAGDTLYILTNQGLYTFGPGDQKAVLRVQLADANFIHYQPGDEQKPGYKPSIGCLFSNGQTLMGIDYNASSVFTIHLEGEALRFDNFFKLDLEDFMDGEGIHRSVRHPQWIKLIDGQLYLRFMNYEGKPVDLYSFDLKTGERREHPVPHLQIAASYKEGSLIAIQADPNNMYDEATQKMRSPELVVYQPADGSLTKLGAYAPDFFTEQASYGDLWYDADQDALFLYTDTDVLRLEGDFKTTRTIGYLPMFGQFWGVPGALQPLPGDRLAIAFGKNVFIRPRTEKGLEGVTVLTLSGSPESEDIIPRILMEMDNIALRRVDGLQYNYINAEQLATMFLTGNVPADIMTINAYGFDLDKLMQKGYLADLSGSQKIKNYLGLIAPNLSKSFQQDGKIYAVPGNIMLSPVCAYTKPFKDTGLDIPTSVSGIIDLTARWVDGLMQEHPDYILFSGGMNLKGTLQDLVISRYIADKLGAGEELVFDTPLFRGMMEKIEQIDFKGMDREPDWENEAARTEMEEYWNKKPLLENAMGFEPRYAGERHHSEESRFQPLILPMEDGGAAYNEADFTLLVVMSSSKNQEAATTFLEHFINKQHPVDKAALNLSDREPVENPLFDQELELAHSNYKLMQAQYEAAQGVDKSNLEDGLKYMDDYIKRLEENARFLATTEDLDMIHGIMSRLFVFSGLGNAQRQAINKNYELRRQYQEGAISLDQFIKQMDDKLRLVRMEYN